MTAFESRILRGSCSLYRPRKNRNCDSSGDIQVPAEAQRSGMPQSGFIRAAKSITAATSGSFRNLFRQRITGRMAICRAA